VLGLAYSSHTAGKNKSLKACLYWNDDSTRPLNWAVTDVMINKAGHAFRTSHITICTSSCSAKGRILQKCFCLMKQNIHCQRKYFVLNTVANYPLQSDRDRQDVDKKCTNLFLDCTECYSCAQFSYALLDIQITQ